MDITTTINPANRPGSNMQSSNGLYYVVYEAGTTNGATRDVAFIEQRTNSVGLPCELSEDELCFPSLKEAKSYVKEQFTSGAEYFSLNQSNDPDSFLYLLADKLTYLLA